MGPGERMGQLNLPNPEEQKGEFGKTNRREKAGRNQSWKEPKERWVVLPYCGGHMLCWEMGQKGQTLTFTQLWAQDISLSINPYPSHGRKALLG